MPASTRTWATWFKAWPAAHWRPGDLPSLEVLILLYDQLRRGEFQRSAELRLWMDTYGLTPKGHQDRRWEPPKEEVPRSLAPPKPDAYAHLRVVDH